MRALRFLFACALLGSIAAPQARAGEIYSYVDEDGVVHFSNVPADARYKRRHARSGGGGVYRKDARTDAALTSPAQARAIARTASLDRFREHVKSAAKKYALPEELLLAVMAVESHFDPSALSEKGAVGLMQLMPGTARDMYVMDAWAPEQNIEGGARYLRILANQYEGDLIRTLAAYNAGPEAVRRAGGAVPAIPETQEYVRKVVALYQAFRAGR
jgi:soluble lytic murein transglycosylase-like protein